MSTTVQVTLCYELKDNHPEVKKYSHLFESSRSRVHTDQMVINEQNLFKKDQAIQVLKENMINFVSQNDQSTINITSWKVSDFPHTRRKEDDNQIKQTN